MSDAATLPVPYLGKNSRDPKAVVKAPECTDILNFNPELEGIKLRNGDDLIIEFAATTLRIIPYGDSELYLVYQSGGDTNILNVNTLATPFGVIGATGDTDIAYLYFNKVLFIMGNRTGGLIPGSGGTITYNGTTWGVSTYTWASGIVPFGGCVYNHRAYFLGYQSSIYNYTPVDITLAATLIAVDIASLLTTQSTIAAICIVTIADTVTTVKYIAFVMFSGEVIFFSGTYPDDPTPGTGWSEVGRAKIGPPVNYNATIEYGGDALIITDIGLFSLRDVFLKGSQDGKTLTISQNIDEDWHKLVTAYRNFIGIPVGDIPGIRGSWDRLTNRIIVSFPGYLNTSNTWSYGSYYFVLDTKQLGWFPQRSFGPRSAFTEKIIDITRSRNKIYILGAATNFTPIWIKEGAVDYQDENAASAKVGYDFLIESAPIPFAKTGIYEADGLEIILQSDQYSVTNYAFIGDLGRITTASQIIADQGVSVAKPLANIGMEATFVQAKISGTTKSGSIGTIYYNFNVWYDKGQKGSR